MSLPLFPKRHISALLLLALPIALSGCGLSTYVYPDANRTRAAIIENSVSTDRRSAIHALLISVDGKEATGNGFLGRPVRVFVKPGHHVLRVTCSYNQAMNLASDYRQTLTLDLKSDFVYRLVPMLSQPRHVDGKCRTVVRAFPRRDDGSSRDE
ncbi:MAG TPA: hypothetical protein VFM97_02810 [Gammaproteobacteria bacterium]|nr:hypothetical protein [Gammaproteobacteria bacterium]